MLPSRPGISYLAAFGGTYTSTACGDWFESILGDAAAGGDGMVDLFAHFYPTAQVVPWPPGRRKGNGVLQRWWRLSQGALLTFACPSAQGRYTCFDQYKNKRYENEGARIDYTIVDQSLLPHVRLGPVGSSSAALVSQPECANPLCETCALAAVTSNGRWKPAPYDGTGIVEGHQEVCVGGNDGSVTQWSKCAALVW